MFGTSGIRGAVGETVTAEFAVALGRAVGTTEDATTAVVGRDPRPSGEFLGAAFTAGLREVGVDVVELGVVATPTVARAVRWQAADFGVAVTASHNPPTDNGFKFWNPTGQAFTAAQRTAIEECLESAAFELAAWDAVGRQTRWQGAEAQHLDALVAGVDVDVDDAPEVVVDVGNGAGGLTATALRRLGCAVTTLNGQPDGHFPGRPSEPTREHLGELSAMVAGSSADLGIAHDGDADRMLAVDETGAFVAGDALLALFAQAAAAPGDQVAAPVNTSLLVDDALAAGGASVTRTRVGDGFVAAKTTEPGVVFGGEPSGAWIWPTETLCPDGPQAAVQLVTLVAEGDSLGSQVGEFTAYPLRRESFEVPNKTAVMDRVETAVAASESSVDTLDGVRVETDAGWFLVRASGTQPLIRVTAEARTEDDCQRLFSEAAGYVKRARE